MFLDLNNSVTYRPVQLTVGAGVKSSELELYALIWTLVYFNLNLFLCKQRSLLFDL